MRENNTWIIRFLGGGWLWVSLLVLGVACTAEVKPFGFSAFDICFTGAAAICPQGQRCTAFSGSPIGTTGICLSECRVGESGACPGNAHCVGTLSAQVNEEGTCQATCKPSVANACPKGQACIETADGANTCQPIPECYVGGSGCEGGQSCVGNLGAPDGTPGRCEDVSECRVGGGGCEEGYICRGGEGAQAGAPGSCQPECRVGSNSGCPAGYVCVGAAEAEYQAPGRCHASCHIGSNDGCPEGHICLGANTFASGTCHLPPQCLVGDDSSCEVWQHCEGIFENQTGAPGYCQGSPQCHVGTTTCSAWQSCVGYESNTNGAPGQCEGEPQCLVGNDSTCPANTPYCIGYESNANGTPGRCEAAAQCYVGAPWTCPANTTCVGNSSTAWNAPGTCQASGTSVRPRDITQLYMFFGHNSVGGEIVDGLGSVVQNLRIISHSRSLISSNGAAYFNQNGSRQPGLLNVSTYDLYRNYGQARQSVELFVEQVRFIINGNATIPGQRLDIVFLKFCFYAFYDMTDEQADLLFDYYATQMDALQSQYPELIVVHFTQTIRPCGNFQNIYDANTRSMHYRSRMLERYGHTGRVFDLALIEATAPNGQVNHCSYRDNAGNPVLGLYQSYAPSSTSNDGHLSTAGRQAVARRLADFLANVR